MNVIATQTTGEVRLQLARKMLRGDGGSLAIAGFVYQFLHNIDRLIEAGLQPVGTRSGSLVVVLESDRADAVYLGPVAEFVQYKTRRGRPWSATQILLEVLPPLLRAAVAHDGPAIIRFSTSGVVSPAASLGRLLQLLGRPAAKSARAAVRFGRRRTSVRDIFEEICSLAGGRDGLDRRGRSKVARLLATARIDEGVTEDDLETRILAELERATGSPERAKRAYHELMGVVAVTSRTAGARVGPDELLARVGLDRESLAPIREFNRRLAMLAEIGIGGTGYEAVLDVRSGSKLISEGLRLVAGESGSGKSWALAREIQTAIDQGRDAVFIDRVRDLDDLRSQIVSAVWSNALARPGQPALWNLGREVGALLREPRAFRLVVAVDELSGDASMLDQIVRQDWAANGVSLIVGVTPGQAARARHLKDDVAVTRLEPFSQEELARLLLVNGLDWRRLPADVRTWLARPVLAGLFVRTAQDKSGWQPADEYQLLAAFARRAVDRGDGDGVFGCAAALRDLGNAYLRRGYPLTKGRIGSRSIAVLLRSGWLKYDTCGGLEFAHDRLLAWAVAEALAAGDDQRVATTLPRLASCHPAPEHLRRAGIGYAVMDTCWLIGTRKNGAAALERLLTELGRTVEGRHLADELYRNLLPTGGECLLTALVSPLVKRLAEGHADEHLRFQADQCLAGFAENSPRPDAALIRRLLRHASLGVQRAGLRFFAKNPDPLQLEPLLDRYHAGRSAAGTMPRFGADAEARRWLDAAYQALLAIVDARPDLLVELYTRGAATDPRLAWTIGFLIDRPTIGAGLWQRHGLDLIGQFGGDPERGFFLARCVDIFSDTRAISQLREWCADQNSLAAMAAWPALCRLDVEAAIDLLGALPVGGLLGSTHRWLGTLMAPDRRPAFHRVIEALRDRDPSGNTFGLVLRGHADDVRDEDVRWASQRLEEALRDDPHGSSAPRSRLLTFLAAIATPDKLDRLHDLCPGTLPAAILSFIMVHLPTEGRVHHSEVADATRLLRLFGGAELDRIFAAKLLHSSDMIRWEAVRQSGFANLEALRTPLLAIATRAAGDREPGRCDALIVLSRHDPAWARQHVRDLLANGAPHSLNEAFWLAQRLPGAEFVDEALVRLDHAFTHSPPSWRLIEHLISHRAGLDAVVVLLERALDTSMIDRSWLLDQLANCRTVVSRDVLIAEITNSNLGGRHDIRNYVFWGAAYDNDEPRWRGLMLELLEDQSTMALRHDGYFYPAAAMLGSGPAFDQLLNDAHPTHKRSRGTAIIAIRALGAVQPTAATAALRNLLALLSRDNRDLSKFAREVAGLTFDGVAAAVYDNVEPWPTDDVLSVFSRLPRLALATLSERIELDFAAASTARRRIAYLAAPWAALPLPASAFDDPDDAVRAAVGVARYWTSARATAALLLERLDAGPIHARRAAAALFGLNARSKHVRVVPWTDLTDRLPPTLHALALAIPKDE